MDETQADPPDPLPDSTAQAFADAGTAILKGWEKGFEAASLLDKSPSANMHAKFTRSFGALNAGINFSRMRSAYERNDMRTAFSVGADLTIDTGVNLIPG